MKKKIISLFIIVTILLLNIAPVLAAEKTGLYKDNGQWKYYENGKFTKATGLVMRPDNKTWYYVEKGILKKVSGLVKCVQPGKSHGKWYYVYKGKQDKSVTGLVRCVQKGSSSYGKWYYVYKGKLNKKTNGAVKSMQPGFKSKTDWYYVVKGKLAKKTGLVMNNQPGHKNNGRWLYVKKGKFNKLTGNAKILYGDNKGREAVVKKGYFVKFVGEPAHEHSWVAVTETVHHDEVGHYETVVIQEAWDEPYEVGHQEVHTTCNGCGEYFDGFTEADMDAHLDSCGSGGWGQRVFWIVDGIEYEHHDAVTEQRWVVDQAAYDETVTTGYKCSSCGASK